MSSCYQYREYACRAPRLRRVPRAYILTMVGSRRLEGGALEPLCRLAASTFVQVNHRGADGCEKPECTRKSNFDLVHAYQAACRHAASSGLAHEAVLFFEDDAVVRADATSAEFASIDAFVAGRAFDVYTLGSIGLVPPWGSVGDHFALLMLWHTQATIWAPPTRARLLEADVATIPHIDAHFLTALPRKFKFRRPLVLQTFPESENSKSWCLHCRDDAFGRIERWGAGAWGMWYREGLGLDRSPLPGWDTLNKIAHAAFGVLALLVSVVVCGIALLLVRRRR